MNQKEFLEAILPPEGCYALVGIQNKQVIQKLYEDIDKLLARAAKAADFDLYFGCSSFLGTTTRKQDNVSRIKSFWIDLDCGAGTAYPTKMDASLALRLFCKDTGLPRPYIVDSGRGLHIYWPMTESISMPEWLVYAKKLPQLFHKAGLQVKDPGVSTDPARILRIPDTLNYKTDPPSPVMLLQLGVATEWPIIKFILHEQCVRFGVSNSFDVPSIFAQPKKPIDKTTAALLGTDYPPACYRELVMRTKRHDGCLQLEYAQLNAATLDEPIWRANLSTAWACVDRDKAIQYISKGHPEYTEENTIAKAQLTEGKAHTCAKYNDLNPGICTKCKHIGKIKNPLQLAPYTEAVPVEQVQAAIDAVPNQETIAFMERPRPKLPAPYSYNDKGGIFIPAKDGIPQKDIYRHELVVRERINDPDKGETAVITLCHPNDTPKEIHVAYTDISSEQSFKGMLSRIGVLGNKVFMDRINNYIIAACHDLQDNSKPLDAYRQMGWTPSRENFVWGRVRYTKLNPKGVYSTPSDRAKSIANMMRIEGDFNTWHNIVEKYAAPGLEMYGGALFCALGSLLNNYTRTDPIWLHLASGASGTGKTTLTWAINSCFGQPKGLMRSKKDTALSFEAIRNIFNSIPICLDELTGITGEEASAMAFSQSEGREKTRLTQKAEIKFNDDTRNNGLVTSANAHVMDLITAKKSNAAGELARLLEIQFDKLKVVLPPEEDMGRINENFGFLPNILMPWLIEHEHELLDRVQKIRAEIMKTINSGHDERNWVGATAAMFAIMDILQQELGLFLAFDRQRIWDTWIKFLLASRETVLQSIVTHRNILGEFMNENYSNTFVPDAAAMSITDETTAVLYGRKSEREARNKLVVHFNRPSQKLCLSHSEVKAFCIKRGHSFTELIGYCSKNFAFAIDLVNMGDGNNLINMHVKALTFKTKGVTFEDAFSEITGKETI